MQTLLRLLAAPLLCVYYVSDRALIRADAGRWVAIDGGATDGFESEPAPVGDLLILLAKRPEFRSLFYFRASRWGVAGKVAARLFQTVWRGAPGLLIGGGT